MSARRIIGALLVASPFVGLVVMWGIASGIWWLGIPIAIVGGLLAGVVVGGLTLLDGP